MLNFLRTLMFAVLCNRSIFVSINFIIHLTSFFVKIKSLLSFYWRRENFGSRYLYNAQREVQTLKGCRRMCPVKRETKSGFSMCVSLRKFQLDCKTQISRYYLLFLFFFFIWNFQNLIHLFMHRRLRRWNWNLADCDRGRMLTMSNI